MDTALQISQGTSEKEKFLGSKLSQVYYSNVGVMAKEDVQFQNQYSQQFQSLAMGSQGVVLQVSPVDLSRQIRCRLVLPAIGANTSLPKGWGYMMLQRIEYRYASSVTLSLDAEQHLFEVMSSCETAEKRNEIITLGGEEVSASTGGVQPEANIFISLPTSHVRHLMNQKPLDNSLLVNGGYQIILYFKPPAQVFGGSGAAAYIAANPNFVSASFQIETARITNQKDSIKDELMSDQRLSYCYPFIYTQSYTTTFGGVLAPNRASIQLNSFRAGELLSIKFAVVAVNDFQGDGTVGGVKNVLANVDPCSNIRLTLNGQPLFDLDGKAHLLMGAYKSIDSAYYPSNAFSPLTQTTSPFSSVAVKNYITELNFSTESPKNYSGGARFTGIRDIANSTMVLELSTATTGQYRIFVTYSYNACLEMKQGTAAFVF